MAIYHLTSCLDCGQQLKPHAGNAQDTPWLCSYCRLGFWTAELQQRPRSTYRGRLDFGPARSLEPLKAQRYAEYVQAFFRGTSAREDQLSIMTITQLEHLLTRKKVDPGFMKLIQAEHGRRGAE